MNSFSVLAIISWFNFLGNALEIPLKNSGKLSIIQAPKHVSKGFPRAEVDGLYFPPLITPPPWNPGERYDPTKNPVFIEIYERDYNSLIHGDRGKYTPNAVKKVNIQEIIDAQKLKPGTYKVDIQSVTQSHTLWVDVK